MFLSLTFHAVDVTVPDVRVTKDAFYRLVGERIAQARRRQQLTQKGLAPAVGLSRASVANVEKGRQAVALHVLVKFSEALGVPITDLIPSDRGSSASFAIKQRLSELSPNQRAWAERVLGSEMMED